MEVLILFGTVYLMVCMACGGYVANQKRRPAWEGMCLAAALGPFGVVVEACLPDRFASEAADRDGRAEKRDSPPPLPRPRGRETSDTAWRMMMGDWTNLK